MSGERYSDQHEWIKLDGNVGTVGISDYAQNALGDVVYVEMPEVGASFAKDDEVAVVESVKAASEIYAPVGGEIVKINSAVEDDPSLVNTSPMDDGWFFKLRVEDPSAVEQLMTEDEYQSFVEGLE